MRIMKMTMAVVLSAVALALAFSACGNPATTTTTTNSSTTNSSTSNGAGQANSARAANSNQTAAGNTGAASNTAKPPANEAEGDKIEGELQVGKSDSVILYVGKESGDYAGYCFANDSEAGRAIMAACKDRTRCEVVGKIDYESTCKVPGLEADLSASGRILKVSSARSLGGKK